MKELLEQYANYNFWANRRMVEMITKIDPLLVDKEVKSSFPSLCKTIYHIWDAELVWMARLKGETLSWPPSDSIPQPSFEKFLQTSNEFAGFVAAKNNDFFTSITVYKNSRGKEFSTVNSGILMHCFNHSTYHRGQVVTLLRGLGVEELIPTDLIAFLR